MGELESENASSARADDEATPIAKAAMPGVNSDMGIQRRRPREPLLAVSFGITSLLFSGRSSGSARLVTALRGAGHREAMTGAQPPALRYGVVVDNVNVSVLV